MRTTLEIDTDIYKTAKKLAVDEDTTVSALVEEGLRHIIEKHQGNVQRAK